jgi:hypothetical protein
MVSRIAPIVCAALLVVATSAWAQSEIRGVVSHVDPATRMVYFTDGRIVQLKPGSTLLINGQPVLLESIRPGATIVMVPPGATTTTVTTVTQQTQVAPPVPAGVPPAAMPLPVLSPVNVTGTVARTDPLTQTITFQDGRIVKVAPNTMVWQQAPAISSILPGAQVFVRDALPVGYVPSGSASAYPPGQYMMGTVSRVDPATNQIILSNGAVVYVSPTATLRSGGQRVAITNLRPGDEILIQVRNPVTVAAPVPAPTNLTIHTAPVPSTADRYVGSALPYQGYADSRIETSDVQIMWSPQSR